MDAGSQQLAETVRAKRAAIDADLAALRARLHRTADRVSANMDARRWAQRALPALGGAGMVWWLARRRRPVRTMEHLLAKELTDLYAIERQQVPVLERMHHRATDTEVRRALEQHRHETIGHADRLVRVFRSIGARAHRRPSKTIAAIMAEGERLLARRATRDVRDASIVATVQRIEHVEIAGYGAARAMARALGFTFAAQLLQQTLEEERTADEKLTMLAEAFINPRSVRA